MTTLKDNPPSCLLSGSLGNMVNKRRSRNLSNLSLGLAALVAVPLATAAKAPMVSESAKSPAQIFADAKAAMLHVKDFHVQGDAVEGTAAITVDISLSHNGGGGTIAMPGVLMHIIVSGKWAYVKADEKTWEKLTGSKSLAQLVANRWIKAPKTSKDFADFVDLTVSDQFVAQLSSSLTAGSVTKVGTITWHGQKVVVLADRQGGKLYVADTGAPYIVYITGAKAHSSGSLTFSEFGTASLPAAPNRSISFP